MLVSIARKITGGARAESIACFQMLLITGLEVAL